MKSLVVKRSIVIARHKTSVSLEEPFWLGLKEIALGQNMTLSTMVGDIDTRCRQGNLSSAIRLLVLLSLRTRASESNGTRATADGVVRESARSHGKDASATGLKDKPDSGTVGIWYTRANGLPGHTAKPCKTYIGCARLS